MPIMLLPGPDDGFRIEPGGVNLPGRPPQPGAGEPPQVHNEPPLVVRNAARGAVNKYLQFGSSVRPAGSAVELAAAAVVKVQHGKMEAGPAADRLLALLDSSNHVSTLLRDEIAIANKAGDDARALAALRIALASGDPGIGGELVTGLIGGTRAGMPLFLPIKASEYMGELTKSEFLKLMEIVSSQELRLEAIPLAIISERLAAFAARKGLTTDGFVDFLLPDKPAPGEAARHFPDNALGAKIGRELACGESGVSEETLHGLYETALTLGFAATQDARRERARLLCEAERRDPDATLKWMLSLLDGTRLDNLTKTLAASDLVDLLIPRGLTEASKLLNHRDPVVSTEAARALSFECADRAIRSHLTDFVQREFYTSGIRALASIVWNGFRYSPPHEISDDVLSRVPLSNDEAASLLAEFKLFAEVMPSRRFANPERPVEAELTVELALRWLGTDNPRLAEAGVRLLHAVGEKYPLEELLSVHLGRDGSRLTPAGREILRLADIPLDFYPTRYPQPERTDESGMPAISSRPALIFGDGALSYEVVSAARQAVLKAIAHFEESKATAIAQLALERVGDDTFKDLFAGREFAAGVARRLRKEYARVFPGEDVEKFRVSAALDYFSGLVKDKRLDDARKVAYVLLELSNSSAYFISCRLLVPLGCHPDQNYDTRISREASLSMLREFTERHLRRVIGCVGSYHNTSTPHAPFPMAESLLELDRLRGNVSIDLIERLRDAGMHTRTDYRARLHAVCRCVADAYRFYDYEELRAIYLESANLEDAQANAGFLESRFPGAIGPFLTLAERRDYPEDIREDALRRAAAIDPDLVAKRLLTYALQEEDPVLSGLAVKLAVLKPSHFAGLLTTYAPAAMNAMRTDDRPESSVWLAQLFDWAASNADARGYLESALSRHKLTEDSIERLEQAFRKIRPGGPQGADSPEPEHGYEYAGYGKPGKSHGPRPQVDTDNEDGGGFSDMLVRIGVGQLLIWRNSPTNPILRANADLMLESYSAGKGGARLELEISRILHGVSEQPLGLMSDPERLQAARAAALSAADFSGMP